MKTIIIIILVLITFSMCQGPNPTTSVDTQTTLSSDKGEMIATVINLNGMLCAQVQSVSKLQIPDEYEVVCTTYRGGTSTSTYIVNKTTGKAFEQ